MVVTSNIGVLDRARAKLSFEIAHRSRLSLSKLGDLGKQFARTIAPNETGRLSSFIVKNMGRTPEGVSVQIQARNPTRGGAHRKFGAGEYPNFNLVRWMHETRGVFQSDNPYGKAGKRHIKSGDPQFMYTTAKEIRRRTPGVVTSGFRNINLRG